MRVLLLTIILAALPLSAAAQDVPIGLNLNGVWELSEYGARQDANALVEISHSGNSVTATFLSGSRCFDGTDRTIAFTATLVGDPTLPPSWRFSSGDMWVCSGSPGLVEECKMSAKYQTAIASATVEPDQISGKRFRNYTKDCATTRESEATGTFSLTRLAPCELEERQFEKAESEMRELQLSLLSAGSLFANAIWAAQQRYGPTFKNLPTDNLKYPYESTNAWGDDLLVTEAFFRATPELFESADWKSAREMAAEMATDAPPLAEAARMLEEMNRIEAMGADGRRAQAAFQTARAALEKCRRAQP